MSNSHHESELVERARAGDTAAFDALAGGQRPRLAGFIRQRLGEGPGAALEVDDVLQETFLRGFRSLERFEPRGRDSLFRWLAGIAVNVVREEARRAARQHPRPGLADDAPASSVSQLRRLRREERFDRLTAALDRLPQDYREVIRLTRLEKLSVEEVARRMGRSRQAVRSLLFRALRALRESFGDTESLRLPPRSLGKEGHPDGS